MNAEAGVLEKRMELRELEIVRSRVNIIKGASHHGRKYYGETHCLLQLIYANDIHGGKEKLSLCLGYRAY